MPPPDRSPLVVLLHTPEVPDPFEAALGAAGFRARSLPVLRFVPVGRDALAGALAVPDRHGGLILTSPRAAEALHDLPLDPRWQHKPAFAVGPKTASVAEALGLDVFGRTAGTAEGLADEIARCRFEAPLLFLCGNRRRDALPQRLAEAGVPVRELCVYETHPRTDLHLGVVPTWLVFFSPSGVEAVQRNAQIDPLRARRAAIGPTTAGALRAAGWPPSAVAPEPTPEALAAALQAAARV